MVHAHQLNLQYLRFTVQLLYNMCRNHLIRCGLYCYISREKNKYIYRLSFWSEEWGAYEMVW
jgi:hypothetical protein